MFFKLLSIKVWSRKYLRSQRWAGKHWAPYNIGLLKTVSKRISVNDLPLFWALNHNAWTHPSTICFSSALTNLHEQIMIYCLADIKGISAQRYPWPFVFFHSAWNFGPVSLWSQSCNNFTSFFTFTLLYFSSQTLNIPYLVHSFSYSITLTLKASRSPEIVAKVEKIHCKSFL